MNVDISNQAYTLLLALLLGAALGVVYDVFKILRLVGLKNKIIVFFEDIIFFLIAALSIFSFYMQVTEGKARIYPVISAAIGFYIYFKTVEKLVFWIVKLVYNALSKTSRFLYKYLLKNPVLFAFSLIKKILKPMIAFVYKKIIRNIIIFFKNLLQKKGKMVYNVGRISKEGKGKRTYAQKQREAQERKKIFVF